MLQHKNGCPLFIDFIVRKDTPYREFEFKRRQKIEIEDVEISIVSIEDLILSKLFWAKDSLSEMQLGDVKNLIVPRQRNS